MTTHKVQGELIAPEVDGFVYKPPTGLGLAARVVACYNWLPCAVRFIESTRDENNRN